MEVDEGIVTSEADEKRELERLSVVATFGILIATIAAAVAGSLAALASVHGDAATASRLSWATYSNQLLLAYNQSASGQGQSVNAALENDWRTKFFTDLANATSDPALRSELDGEALQTIGVPDAPATAGPAFVSPRPAQWCRNLDQRFDCAYEVANAYGATALADDRQERAYIACVSLLAIALFLFALSKMLSQPSMEKLFLVLGSLITLVAVGWMATEARTTPARQPSPTAIRAYEHGWQLEQQSRDPARVVALLQTATADDPTLADAWQQLGEEELFQGTGRLGPARCRVAVPALDHVWQLRGDPEDRDRLAVGEVLCGDPRGALSLMGPSTSDSSDVLAGPARALAQLASGHAVGAMRTLHAAVMTMEGEGGGLRGPVFTTYWFDQYLVEVDALRATHPRLAHLARFVEQIERDDTESTLADFGQSVPRPAPGASVVATHVFETSQLGSVANRVPVDIVLEYSGLRSGDVVVVAWDQSNIVENSRFIPLTLPGTSVLVVGQPGGPRPGAGTFHLPAIGYLTKGTYRVSVSLDAAPVGTPIRFTVRHTASAPGAPPVPLQTPFASSPPTPISTTTSTTSSGLGGCESTTTTSTVPGELPSVGCAAPSP